ncbi:hypothetical protein [Frigoriflavimonas asaccharolytica]|uniref:Uncharacterized protein n=1 Tax=Frigoriflavimonas asaccharolytica TaxID=2735899 RepID=A0A8J8G8N2_9FLAO|nr:hypothetical protein [Frigoriflavimonas asaccharolytica]NRS91977.1 hypothetical protein [Frigoriflavimonas asaccharolytica]
MVLENSKDNEIILKIPADFDILGLQRIINYLKYKEIIKKSEATQEIADQLAEESKTNWWQENKDK